MAWDLLLFLLLLSRLSRFCNCFQQPRAPPVLRFRPDGQFKILQVADMHYANGATTPCKDVMPWQRRGCSDLNTTAFVKRLIEAEQPDLIVFSGDNIFGRDALDPVASLNSAFAPAIDAKTPWAAVLGNHDQESSLSRRQVMEHIVKMDYTLSKVYPEGNSSMQIDGFGNYHLEVFGAKDSELEGKRVLNLYMLDSGDYSQQRKIHGYGWIQESQKRWFKDLSVRLQNEAGTDWVPGLVYFHIPLVETRGVARCTMVGQKQETVGSASVNSGFLDAIREAGDVIGVFTGHDHVNDFCADFRGTNIKTCYGGGVGYHAYGKASWSRRARVVVASLGPSAKSSNLRQQAEQARNPASGLEDDAPSLPPFSHSVHTISTWKRLNDPPFSLIDRQLLYSSTSHSLATGPSQLPWWTARTPYPFLLFISLYFLFSIVFAYTMSWWPFHRSSPRLPNSLYHRSLPHSSLTYTMIQEHSLA